MTTTLVSVNTYTHTVAYVTDKLLSSVKRIITWSGLDPTKYAANWSLVEGGIKTWLQSQHLVAVVLEVSNPTNGQLVGRWDFDIAYTSGNADDGEFWVDTDAIKHAIRKQGLLPASCPYQLVVSNKPGAASVPGWSFTTLLSTEGFVRYSIGTTIGTNSLATGVSYWRKS